MTLTQYEEKSYNKEGWLYLGSILLVTTLIYTGSFFLLKNYREESQTILGEIQTQKVELTKINKEIIFLKINEKQINEMWNTLNQWGQGITPDNLTALSQVGIQSSPGLEPPLSGGNAQPQQFSRVSAYGEKTEFKRLITALATLESQQGLLQVTKANLALPTTTQPYSNQPTYLQIELDLSSPLMSNFRGNPQTNPQNPGGFSPPPGIQ